MIEILPIRTGVMKGRFDLYRVLQGFEYRKDDVLIISSKFVSMSEGRVIDLCKVRVSKKAKALADKCKMEPKIAELVLRESDFILKGVPGFLLAIRKGMIAPNAGIDRSNAPRGCAILYPRDPFGTAEKLRKKFLADRKMRVGIIIADSRLMPTRIGTTGVAIACAGFQPVEDLRGKRDLFGNFLKYTLKAIADGLATMGVCVMGESDESTPAVVVRGVEVTWSKKKFSWKDMAVSPSDDIYLRHGLS